MRKLLTAAAVAALTATPIAAQVQQGLVNVTIEDINIVRNALNNNNVNVAVPVNVQVPIGVAANVCGISVAAIREQNNTCTAKTATQALGQALSKQGIGQ